MKKNRLAALLVGILGGVAIYFLMHNTRSTIRPELEQFGFADTGSINKIHLKDKADKEVTLERLPNGRWKLDGKYYARPDAISDLLVTIRKIKVRNPVGKNARKNVITQLATGCTKVELFANDKLVKVYYIGGQTQDDEGTYMLLEDPETGTKDSLPFVVTIPGFNGYVSGRYFTSEKDWRDRTVFNYRWNEIRSIKVDYALEKDSSFTLNVLGENNFEMLDARGGRMSDLDTGKIKLYLGYFYSVNYEGLEKIRPSTKDSTLALGWVHSIAVTDVNGKTTMIRTYRKPPPSEGMEDRKGKPLKEDTDRMYAALNDNTNEMVLVQYFVFGKLFMPSSHFIRKPKIKMKLK